MKVKYIYFLAVVTRKDFRLLSMNINNEQKVLHTTLTCSTQGGFCYTYISSVFFLTNNKSDTLNELIAITEHNTHFSVEKVTIL